MKKSFAVLLALTLAFAVFAVIPSAAGTNPEYEIGYAETAPTLDGGISADEYGDPLVSWSVSDGEKDGILLDLYEITDDPELSIDFYATWTKTDLYLAWEVHTKYDFRVPDGIEDGYMYEYCCVQFILTPGAPDNSTTKYQTAQWSGNYLEIGLCLRDDGLSHKVCWSEPDTSAGSLWGSDWEFVGSRDEETEVTVYECRLPLDTIGLEATGNGTQFGLTWAVGAQENYETVTKGLIEWQDAIVGGKNADNAAVITMVGADESEPSDPGDDPSDPGDDPSDPGDDPSDPGDDPSDPGDDPSDPGDDPTVSLGDIDGNGKINSTDYLLLKRYCLGSFELTEEQKAFADVNKDGKINAVDYLLVKRHVLGTFIIA